MGKKESGCLLLSLFKGVILGEEGARFIGIALIQRCHFSSRTTNLRKIRNDAKNQIGLHF